MTRSLSSSALLLFSLLMASAPGNATSQGWVTEPGNATSPCYAVNADPPRELMNAGYYDWRKVTPLEYIKYLKTLKEPYTVWGCKEGWVTESDIPELMILLESDEPCVRQLAAVNSFIDSRRSSVGNEAAWLIESFRVGRFPPGNGSTGAPKRDELRKWWVEQSFHPPMRPTGRLL